VNKEKLLFSDKVSVVYPKESVSELNLNEEENLIEYKNIIQSDNFSFGNEEDKIIYSEKFFYKNLFLINDLLISSKIENNVNKCFDNINILDKYVKSENNLSFKIEFPKNDSTFYVGEKIYFECVIVTDDELIKSNFDDLIWVSSLDGLIGVKNKFSTMLSFGNHIISLIENKNNIKTVKDNIYIKITEKSTHLPEIEKL
jgi:hypothetical protein